MRNLWVVFLLVSAACRKDEPETSAVVKHDATPAKPLVDDTAPIEPFASGADCDGEAACDAACKASRSRACRALGALRKLALPEICALGDGLACFEAAMATPGALEVTARDTLTRSCDLGDAVSCHHLADFDRHGTLGRRDTTAAQVLDRKACELGLAQGCFETFDYERALAIELTACDRGDIEACGGAMAPAQQIGGDRPDRVRRRLERALDRACETDAEACYQGTLIAGNAASVATWWTRADKLWAAACDAGDRAACLELAAVLAPGEDATPPPQLDRHRDPFRGKKYWKRACELDASDTLACAEASRP